MNNFIFSCRLQHLDEYWSMGPMGNVFATAYAISDCDNIKLCADFPIYLEDYKYHHKITGTHHLKISICAQVGIRLVEEVVMFTINRQSLPGCMLRDRNENIIVTYDGYLVGIENSNDHKIPVEITFKYEKSFILCSRITAIIPKVLAKKLEERIDLLIEAYRKMV